MAAFGCAEADVLLWSPGKVDIRTRLAVQLMQHSFHCIHPGRPLAPMRLAQAQVPGCLGSAVLGLRGGSRAPVCEGRSAR